MWNIIPGLFMGMTREFFEVAMSATNSYDIIPATDDVIISGVLKEKLENNFFVENPDNYSYVFPRYKPCFSEDYERLKTGNAPYVDNPNVVNIYPVVQFRTLYGDFPERAEKGHELEHLYELYYTENQ
jgi:hypothetical protein